MKNNSVHTVLAAVFVFIMLPAIHAQTGEGLKNMCGSAIPPQAWENEFQKLIGPQHTSQKTEQTESVMYTIPVIVHVIHGGQAVGSFPNIAQGQINSQILVLNNDYAGTGYNTSNYPALAFSNWATAQNIAQASLDPNGRIKIANCYVQFCLATKDTLGNLLPEPGIDRINYISKGWANPTSFTSSASFQGFIDGTVKPQTIWNVTKYFNIWLTDENLNSTGGLLGYATFPKLSTLTGLFGTGSSTTDGVWCYTKTFGSASTFPSGTYYTGYNKGRTCTHEAGHYLGLRHIWGDGDCSATDYCSDTPPAGAENFGAPTYPYNVGVCTGNTPNGEMFMNFMDYTNDNGKYMFTTDQSTRVQTAMANSPYRKFLGTHGLCSASNIAASASFNNPVGACTGVGFTLANTSSGFPSPTYTWSSSGGTISPNVNINSPVINFSAPGIYTISLAANNGTLSTITRTINVTSPAVTLSTTAQAVCSGAQITISADGVDSYTWLPSQIESPSVTFIPVQTQTYTCVAALINGCTTSATIAVIVSDCTGINELADQAVFSVYPNPARDLVNVEISTGSNMHVEFELIDALGKTALSQEINFGSGKQKQALDISALSKGVYLMRLKLSNGSTQHMKLVKD